MHENMDNLTIKEFLEKNMGPQSIAPEIVIPITIMYVVLFVTGVIGNVVVCLVVVRNSHFQTPTNFYLCSLAISDLLILLFGLPNDLKVYWQQYPWELGETVCKLRALVAEMTSYASVLTIVAFSVERYIAVCRPLLLHAISTLPRAVRIITAVWVVACVSALPFALFTKVNYIRLPTGEKVRESAFCALPLNDNGISLPLVQCATLAFFVLPMTVIVVLYAKIGLRLRRHAPQLSASKESGGSCGGDAGGHGQYRASRKSVHKMLVAVVIAFFGCWAPFHAQRLLSVYVDPLQWTRNLRTLNEVLYYSAGCLYYFSATINPILYSLLSAKYREAFRETLCYFSSSGGGRSREDFRRGRYSGHFVSDRYHSIRGDWRNGGGGSSARSSPAELRHPPARRAAAASPCGLPPTPSQISSESPTPSNGYLKTGGSPPSVPNGFWRDNWSSTATPTSLCVPQPLLLTTNPGLNRTVSSSQETPV